MTEAFSLIGDTSINLGFWEQSSISQSRNIVGAGFADGNILGTDNLGNVIGNLYCHQDGDITSTGTIVDNQNVSNNDDVDSSDDIEITCKGMVAP